MFQTKQEVASTRPLFPTPIIWTEDVIFAGYPTGPSTVTGFSCWLILLDAHLGISETNDLRLATFLDENSGLLLAARRPLHFSVPAKLLSTVRNHLSFF
jgi:hypothetical protein